MIDVAYGLGSSTNQMVEVSKSLCGWLDQPKLMRRPKSGGCVATKMVEKTKFLSGIANKMDEVTPRSGRQY
jgi:hypothetical protein